MKPSIYSGCPRPNSIVGNHIQYLLPIITKTILLIILFSGCQDCNRGKISANEQLDEIEMQYGSIPNVGNTCYMNAALQIIARIYPDLFSHKNDILEHCGQVIVDKLLANEEQVSATDAKEFFHALQGSYNVGKSRDRQLCTGQQEDAQPVLDFLLHRGKIQEIKLYATKRHPNGTYETTTAPSPTTGQFIIATLTSTVNSMDQLVANTLHGNLAYNVNWDQSRDNLVKQDCAIMGNRLSTKNLRALTNSILPILVLRYGQIENRDPSKARKITTSITNPFRLTIAADYLREGELYTSTLVGFIHHDSVDGSIEHGHYTAYVKNKVGKWVVYNDSRVMVLEKEPLQKAQEAYLYFYQAD
jgi:hypothetical protein